MWAPIRFYRFLKPSQNPDFTFIVCCNLQSCRMYVTVNAHDFYIFAHSFKIELFLFRDEQSKKKIGSGQISKFQMYVQLLFVQITRWFNTNNVKENLYGTWLFGYIISNGLTYSDKKFNRYVKCIVNDYLINNEIPGYYSFK